jgi:glycosyltransferase involved in cell wall biosynthesis
MSELPGPPLISIITVIYNGARTIERTIQSVLSQSYENIEYIIIDGGSTDGTIDIIRKYEDRICFWISESDKGIYDAMNKGIKNTRGELVGIINADDWYEKDIISYIADIYIKSDHKTVIYGLIRNFKDEEFFSIKGNSVNVLKYDMIQHPTCFIPKSLYDQHGTYDIKYKYSADYDLVLRYISTGIKFNFVERVIANFSLGGGSALNRAQKEKYQILSKYKLISGTEAVLRIVLLYSIGIVKRFLNIRREKDDTVHSDYNLDF